MSVTLICIVFKVMEKIIRRVMKHLERSMFISTNQHDFQDGKSCLINLLQLIDRVIEVRQEREGWGRYVIVNCCVGAVLDHIGTMNTNTLLIFVLTVCQS